MKTKKELIQEQKKAFKQVLCILICFIISTTMLCSVVMMQVKKNELTQSVNSLKEEIKIKENENLHLHSQLEKMYSISEIDRYAVKKLGMTKLNSDQIIYIDTQKYK